MELCLAVAEFRWQSSGRRWALRVKTRGAGHHCLGWSQDPRTLTTLAKPLPLAHSLTRPICPEPLGPVSVRASSECVLVTTQSPGPAGRPLPLDAHLHETQQARPWTTCSPFSWTLFTVPFGWSQAKHSMSLVSSRNVPSLSCSNWNGTFPSRYVFPCRHLSNPLSHRAWRWLPASHCCFLTVLHPSSMPPTPDVNLMSPVNTTCYRSLLQLTVLIFNTTSVTAPGNSHIHREGPISTSPCFDSSFQWHSLLGFLLRPGRYH